MGLNIASDVIVGTVGKIIDTVAGYFPNAEDKAKFLAAAKAAEDAGEMERIKLGLSVILSDSASADKWTSRARPAFMYVMYAIILWALPFSIIFAISPQHAKDAAEGFKYWLDAIPEPMWQLFGAGYLGYVGARTYEKHSDNKTQTTIAVSNAMKTPGSVK